MNWGGLNPLLWVIFINSPPHGTFAGVGGAAASLPATSFVWALPPAASRQASAAGVVTHCTPHTSCAHREVVLEASSDEFYAAHRYSNYGEVGLAVKEAVEKFSATSAQHRQVGRRDVWHVCLYVWGGGQQCVCCAVVVAGCSL